MTRLGWFGCLVLVFFFLSGLAAFLIGGLWAVGYVVQAFLVVVFWWTCRELYRTFSEDLLDNIRRDRAFDEWERRQAPRIRGME